MHKSSVTTILSLVFFLVNAQEKRIFTYKSEPVNFLAQNNRMTDHFSYPGMNVYVLIGDSSASLDSLYHNDEFRQMPISGIKDYSCFYYLQYNIFLTNTEIIEFLKNFIYYNYDKDLVNRNKVHLIWLAKDYGLRCDTIEKLNKVIASLHTTAKVQSDTCTSTVQIHSSVADTWQQAAATRTSITYAVPGFLEMEEKQRIEKSNNLSKRYSSWSNQLFFQITGGKHTIGTPYRTDFDTSTLVDFARIKTIWNIVAGYHISNRVALIVNAGFMYSGKHKQVDGINWGGGGGITVNGSGYAGAMIRYGLGARFIPHIKKRLTVHIDLLAGKMKVIAGGGEGTRTIGGGGGSADDILKKKGNTIYYVLGPGINYRLEKSFHFTSNLQYKIAPLKESIGSVTAFTGISFNAGIGFNFSTKREKND